MNANAMKQESSLVDSNGSGSSTSPKRGWVRTEQGWEPLDLRLKNIVEQIRMGTPYKTIAFQFGINVSRVSQIRHRAGIQRRRQPQESI